MQPILVPSSHFLDLHLFFSSDLKNHSKSQCNPCVSWEQMKGFGQDIKQTRTLHGENRFLDCEWLATLVCRSQSVNNECGWIPSASFHNCKMTSAITMRVFWEKNKKGLLFTGPGNYKTHLGLHSEVMSRGRGRELAWDSAFYWSRGQDPRISWACSLSVNLKCKSGDLKCRKREKQMIQMVNY